MELYYIGNNLFDEFPTATIEECKEYCLKQKELGIDIETSRKYIRGTYPENVYKPGLDPYVTRIVMVQIGTLEKRFVIDARVIDLSFLKEILPNQEILKVGHNLKFEGKHFLHNLGVEMRNVYDTMIAEKCISNGKNISYSLAALSLMYLGIKPIESIDLFTNLDALVSAKASQLYSNNQFHNVSEEEMLALAEEDLLEKEFLDKSTRLGFINIGDTPFTIKQIKYGEEDIINPLKIKKLQEKKINQQKIKNGVLLENAFTQVLADMEYRGVGISKRKWLELADKNYQIYLERLRFLNTYVENNHPEFCGGNDLFTQTPSCLIQWSSSKQVIKLFKKLGIAVKERSKHTGKLEWTVGAKVLLRKLPGEYKGKFFNYSFPKTVEKNEDLTLAYLLYKKSEQLITTFGKEWLKYVHPITNRVHPNFNQYMQTGRLSSTNPNMQNIPNTSSFRSCFVSKGKWLSADYKAQEVRVLAQVTGVKDLQDFFTKGDNFFGEDFHSFVATKMFKIIHNDPDYVVPPKELPNTGERNPAFTHQHSDERNKSKNATFKMAFGGSGYTMAMDLGVSQEEGEAFVQGWFNGFEGLEKNFELTKKLAQKRGWIELDQFTKKKYFFAKFQEMSNYRNEIYKLVPHYDSLTKAQRKELPQAKEITKLWRNYFYLHNKLGRKALNYRIQGAAAMMTKIALLIIHRWRWDNKYQNVCIVFLPVHDEINGECLDQSLVKAFSDVISNSMIKAGSYICPNVLMAADTEVESFWKH